MCQEGKRTTRLTEPSRIGDVREPITEPSRIGDAPRAHPVSATLREPIPYRRRSASPSRIGDAPRAHPVSATLREPIPYRRRSASPSRIGDAPRAHPVSATLREPIPYRRRSASPSRIGDAPRAHPVSATLREPMAARDASDPGEYAGLGASRRPFTNVHGHDDLDPVRTGLRSDVIVELVIHDGVVDDRYRSWERLLGYISEWATMRESLGGIELVYEQPPGVTRTLELVLSPDEWDDYIGTVFGTDDPRATPLRRQVLATPEWAPYLVYGTYDLVPSPTSELRKYDLEDDGQNQDEESDDSDVVGPGPDYVAGYDRRNG